MGDDVGMRVRTAANVLAVAIVVLLIAAGPAGAAETKAVAPQNLRLSVTPKSGPAGTLLTIKSVDACPLLGGLASQFADVSIAYFTTSDAIPVETVEGSVAGDGSWAAKFAVPANETGPARVWASCSRPGVQLRAQYPEVRFDVTTRGAGFWLVSATPLPAGCFCKTTTNVLAVGDAHDYGPRPALTGPPLAGIAPDPTTGTGYWLAQSDGGVFAIGSSRFFGAAARLQLTRPVVGIAATPSGRGYWLVASDGGVFAFGDARFVGSTGGLRLAAPVVGIAATPSGRGYWLVASDGGVFGFGDARFFGSAAGLRLTRPVVGIAAMPSGRGYWLVASDGGVFSFGDARFAGSPAAHGSVTSVVGMAPTPSGRGYWLAMSTGAVFAYGDAQAQAACVEGCGTNAVVAIARTPLTDARN
jgi:hypothetical protein